MSHKVVEMDEQNPILDGSNESTTTKRKLRSAQKPLASKPTSSIKIRESSPNGTHIATHHITPTGISTIPAARKPPSTNPSASLLIRLLTPFLPTNYPHSVTADYTPYQIYDSLQAFASTIASLLASRAVLTSLGVGGEDPSSTATAATLVSIAQNSIGQFTSIFFAHYFALRIEAEVKFYRFLADVVNDAAFLLDVMSPSLPTYARVPALCTASACRAICGVCGGSSKAILSAHFARAGNIGELNAKDGSQETVVSLVGMWAGGLVVSRVTGERETWIWMLVLLGMHLWTNWMAVKSVRLSTLNRGRAEMVFERLLEGRKDIGVEDIGDAEKVFAIGHNFSRKGTPIGFCSPDSISELFSKVSASDAAFWQRLLGMFNNEHYLLWLDQQYHRCIIMLKEDADGETQLKAWSHALRVLLQQKNISSSTEAALDALEETLLKNQKDWETWKSQLQSGGWEMNCSNLAISSGHRIQIQVD